MTFSDFPAIFRNADNSAISLQRRYLQLTAIQYVLLIAAASATVGNGLFEVKYSVGFYLAFVALGAMLLLYSSQRKFDQDWYSARALAESLKTLSWRFSMAAEPFTDDKSDQEATQRFYEIVNDLKKAHPNLDRALLVGAEHGNQVTEKMLMLRNSSLAVRVGTYRRMRIDDQFAWYLKRSTQFKRRANIFTWLIVIAYFVAFVLGLFQFANPNSKFIWASEPILVISASLIGWIQAKRFAELSAAYNLTAHEISQMRSLFDISSEPANFSDLVNHAERAFSREHTQWQARSKV